MRAYDAGDGSDAGAVVVFDIAEVVCGEDGGDEETDGQGDEQDVVMVGSCEGVECADDHHRAHKYEDAEITEGEVFVADGFCCVEEASEKADDADDEHGEAAYGDKDEAEGGPDGEHQQTGEEDLAWGEDTVNDDAAPAATVGGIDVVAEIIVVVNQVRGGVIEDAADEDDWEEAPVGGGGVREGEGGADEHGYYRGGERKDSHGLYPLCGPSHKCSGHRSSLRISCFEDRYYNIRQRRGNDVYSAIL